LYTCAHGIIDVKPWSRDNCAVRCQPQRKPPYVTCREVSWLLSARLVQERLEPRDLADLGLIDRGDDRNGRGVPREEGRWSQSIDLSQRGQTIPRGARCAVPIARDHREVH